MHLINHSVYTGALVSSKVKQQLLAVMAGSLESYSSVATVGLRKKIKDNNKRVKQTVPKVFSMPEHSFVIKKLNTVQHRQTCSTFPSSFKLPRTHSLKDFK